MKRFRPIRLQWRALESFIACPRHSGSRRGLRPGTLPPCPGCFALSPPTGIMGSKNREIGVNEMGCMVSAASSCPPSARPSFHRRLFYTGSHGAHPFLAENRRGSRQARRPGRCPLMRGTPAAERPLHHLSLRQIRPVMQAVSMAGSFHEWIFGRLLRRRHAIESESPAVRGSMGGGEDSSRSLPPSFSAPRADGRAFPTPWRPCEAAPAWLPLQGAAGPGARPGT